MDFIEQAQSAARVVACGLREFLRDDHARLVSADVQFLPAALSAFAMLRSSLFTFSDNRQPAAIDDEMNRAVRWDAAELHVELLAAPGLRRVIRRDQFEAHHPEE